MAYFNSISGKGGVWFWLTIASSITSLVMVIVMARQGAPLSVPDHGIAGQVTLEFAGNHERMLEILDTWDARGLTPVIRENIRLDYIFLFAYSAFLLFGYRLLSNLYPLLYKRTFIKWIVLCTGPGLLDIFENLIMDHWITHDGQGVPPEVIKVMVLVKFVVALGMAIIITGGLLNIALQKLMRI